MEQSFKVDENKRVFIVEDAKKKSAARTFCIGSGFINRKDIEPAWSITANKSQGREYEHVVVVLPRTVDELAPCFVRNHLRVMFSRAKRTLIVLGSRQVFEALAQRLADERLTMLADTLTLKLEPYRARLSTKSDNENDLDEIRHHYSTDVKAVYKIGATITPKKTTTTATTTPRKTEQDDQSHSSSHSVPTLTNEFITNASNAEVAEALIHMYDNKKKRKKTTTKKPVAVEEEEEEEEDSSDDMLVSEAEEKGSDESESDPSSEEEDDDDDDDDPQAADDADRARLEIADDRDEPSSGDLDFVVPDDASLSEVHSEEEEDAKSSQLIDDLELDDVPLSPATTIIKKRSFSDMMASSSSSSSGNDDNIFNEEEEEEGDDAMLIDPPPTQLPLTFLDDDDDGVPVTKRARIEA